MGAPHASRRGGECAARTIHRVSAVEGIGAAARRSSRPVTPDIRADSASRDSRRCVADARLVLNRGHGRDPRMRIAAEVHAEGRDPAYRDLALYYVRSYAP